MDMKGLRPRLLPPGRKEELDREGTYYTPFGEFLMTFFVPVGEDIGHISKVLLDVADYSYLLELCEKNINDDYYITPLAEIIGIHNADAVEMMVLSTNDGRYGAAAIVSKKIRQKVSECYGGENYLIPSSVHEWIIVPRNMPPEDLLRINESINDSEVNGNDFLANGIFEILNGELRRVM